MYIYILAELAGEDSLIPCNCKRQRRHGGSSLGKWCRSRSRLSGWHQQICKQLAPKHNDKSTQLSCIQMVDCITCLLQAVKMLIKKHMCLASQKVAYAFICLPILGVRPRMHCSSADLRVALTLLSGTRSTILRNLSTLLWCHETPLVRWGESQL